VIGMNRLRAAYAELDPGVDRFITSAHDDDRGVRQTYTYFPHSADLVQFPSSSAMFILVVDSVVAGVLAGLVANAAVASGAVIAIASAAAGIGYSATWIWHFSHRVTGKQVQLDALFPHPGQ
jgi:hypothetical protein